MEILDAKNKIDENKLKEIAHSIKNGKICVFPTETVYGIGTNGLDEKAVEKVYQIKKRNKKNPSNLLVSDMNMIERVTQDISSLEYKLMEAFFPGPFTIILKKRAIVPSLVTANSNYVGIRMPSNTIAQKLVSLANIPIVAPSANISGKLSGTNLKDIIDELSGNLDFAIDGGESKIGMESTIVKVIDNVPHILRPGFVTPKQIENVAGNAILENDNTSFLPSAHIEHYQLNVTATLIYSKDSPKMTDKIISLSKNYQNPIIVCCSENVNYYATILDPKNIISVSSKYDLEDYSKNLFTSLHKASSLYPDIVLIEGIDQKDGLGIAIMNRLKHLCNNYFNLDNTI